MELCNSGSGTKGTEELGNARSNKNRRGVQDVKEYLYSQCQDWFEFGNVPEHIMNITICQRASTEAEHSTNCIPDRNKVTLITSSYLLHFVIYLYMFDILINTACTNAIIYTQ